MLGVPPMPRDARPVRRRSLSAGQSDVPGTQLSSRSEMFCFDLKLLAESQPFNYFFDFMYAGL